MTSTACYNKNKGDTAVQPYSTILGRHKAEVIAGLQIIPILLDAAVITDMYTLGHTIQHQFLTQQTKVPMSLNESSPYIREQ